MEPEINYEDFAQMVADAQGVPEVRLRCTDVLPWCLGRTNGSGCTCSTPHDLLADPEIALERLKVKGEIKSLRRQLAESQKRVKMLEGLLAAVHHREGGWANALLDYIDSNRNRSVFWLRRAGSEIRELINAKPALTGAEAQEQLSLFG